MPKIHYFQRYSSVENTVTNNTLQLIARIYNHSNGQASKLLTTLIGEPIEIGIEINQQERKNESVPDGALIQRSFKILIESKVESGTNEDQLVRHATTFTNETQKILLLLTVQKIGQEQEKHISEAISKKLSGVVFRNVTYEDICNALNGLFREFEYEMKALAEDYIEYCNDTGLFDQSRFLMRIVPCGDSYTLNRKYGMYFQPSDRGYTNHCYVGVYAQKRVQCLWAIDSVFDVNYDGQKLTKKYVQGRDVTDYDERIIAMIAEAKQVCDYDIQTGHRFFCGKAARDTDFVKSSWGGIMGARFVNVKEVVGQFTDDSDLATKLMGKTWE